MGLAVAPPPPGWSCGCLTCRPTCGGCRASCGGGPCGCAPGCGTSSSRGSGEVPPGGQSPAPSSGEAPAAPLTLGRQLTPPWARPACRTLGALAMPPGTFPPLPAWPEQGLGPSFLIAGLGGGVTRAHWGQAAPHGFPLPSPHPRLTTALTGFCFLCSPPVSSPLPPEAAPPVHLAQKRMPPSHRA